MGLYNLLFGLPEHHPAFNDTVAIQFKFGELAMHQYALGERIIWGTTSRPMEADHLVLVQGFDCPAHNGARSLSNALEEGIDIAKALSDSKKRSRKYIVAILNDIILNLRVVDDDEWEFYFDKIGDIGYISLSDPGIIKDITGRIS